MKNNKSQKDIQSLFDTLIKLSVTGSFLFGGYEFSHAKSVSDANTQGDRLICSKVIDQKIYCSDSNFYSVKDTPVELVLRGGEQSIADLEKAIKLASKTKGNEDLIGGLKGLIARIKNSSDGKNIGAKIPLGKQPLNYLNKKIHNDANFELQVDDDEARKFVKILENEGLMRAGFVIHESNNLTVSVKEGESFVSDEGFQINISEKEADKFLGVLKDEGLMRAGFVIHESNNLTVSLVREDQKQEVNRKK